MTLKKTTELLDSLVRCYKKMQEMADRVNEPSKEEFTAIDDEMQELIQEYDREQLKTNKWSH